MAKTENETGAEEIKTEEKTTDEEFSYAKYWDMEPGKRPLNPWEPGGDAFANYMRQKAFTSSKRKAEPVSALEQIKKLEARLGHDL